MEIPPDIGMSLHGKTVVAEVGRSVYVGRCQELDRENLLLVEVDSHEEDESGKGKDGKSNREFLERAAKFGVWNTHKRVTLKTAEVEKLIPLKDL